jgi:ribonucleoside-diphosphate reductase subunit M2
MLSTHTGQNDSSGKIWHNDSVDEEKCRFVGEVDLPERERDDHIVTHTTTLIVCQDQEPLLMESTRRFVLFPIQYPDVSRLFTYASWDFSQSADRYGGCTNKPKRLSGVWKR